MMYACGGILVLVAGDGRGEGRSYANYVLANVIRPGFNVRKKNNGKTLVWRTISAHLYGARTYII